MFGLMPMVSAAAPASGGGGIVVQLGNGSNFSAGFSSWSTFTEPGSIGEPLWSIVSGKAQVDTYGANPAIQYIALRGELAANLEVGKTYRLAGDVTFPVGTGATMGAFMIDTTDSTDYAYSISMASGTSASFQHDFLVEFVECVGVVFRLQPGGDVNSGVFTIDNVTLIELPA